VKLRDEDAPEYHCQEPEPREVLESATDTLGAVAYQGHVEPCYKREFVFHTLRSWPRPGSSSAVGATPSLEVLALLQQVAVLKRKRLRPLLTSCDRLFWTVLQSLWSRWTRSSSS
jgi:hypothetical protein